MRPMDAGSPSAVSRTVIEYEAEVTGPRGTVTGAGSPTAGAVSVLISAAIVSSRDWSS
jgi:hypothetical protein